MNEPNRNPDPDLELDALFARARAQRPDTSAAEYAFETRLMARLREKRRPDPESIWASVSWKLSPIFAACVIGLAIWHGQVVRETEAAEQMVYVANPTTFESLHSLN
ncbi:MAG: hypothetical protein LV481_16410 [Methylacidiphilales bacterium]|nr:hypothetical protein [Candidatus Methylacidiphilales bacterium]